MDETGPPLAASWKFAPVNVTEQPGEGLLGKIRDRRSKRVRRYRCERQVSPTPNTGAAMRISLLPFGSLKVASSSPSGTVHRTIRSPPTVGKPCSASMLPSETLP